MSSFSGGVRVARIGLASRGERRKYPAARRSAAAAPAAATIHASRSRFFRFVATIAGAPAWEPASAIHRSSLITSCALCHRSSGSFARQFFSTRSIAGGVIGAMLETGRGSSRRMEEMSETRLPPVNAFFAVAIS